jgi:hypothetical protein
MSETETDYDDEDLSAPPKKSSRERTTSSNTNSVNLGLTGDGGDTQDEDIQEVSLHQFRPSHKRKRDDVPSASSTAPITARRGEEGTLCNIVNAYPVRWRQTRLV